MVLSRLFTVEQTGAAFWPHRGARRFWGAGGCGPRLIAGAEGVGRGHPGFTLVLVSLQLSMVVEGFRGNRGLVP